MRYLGFLSLLLLMLAGCASSTSAGAPKSQITKTKPIIQPIRVLILGGGSSHDFKRWWGGTDAATLGELPQVTTQYTEDLDTIVPLLATTDVLCIANNKPFAQAATRQAIMDFANQGKGLVMLHAGMWYSWRDWPEFNRVLVGGGARAHDNIAPFEVKVTDPTHPIMKDVPASFMATDELYHTEVDPAGTPIHPLATAYSALTKQTYASVFIVEHPKARIVCIALGHDGRVHDLAAYKQLLKNSVSWAAGR